MGAPVYLRHPSSLTHDTGPGHPERPARIRALETALAEHGWGGYEVREAPAVTDEDLLAVHPRSHVEAVQRLSARGGGAVDPDTTASPGTAEAARHAAGGAVALVDALLDGSAPTGLSALRPPGHHAEAARAMGFCFFNSVAIAARHALTARGVPRVLIVDWDVHHGNGTAAIFATVPEVLYVSLHQWPLYPGTGALEDAGRGAGAGTTLNLPLPPGSGDALWCSLVEHVVVPAARAYGPGLILISAGYDAHADDALAQCALTDDGFRTMARSLRRLAAELEVPIGAVLEGGYDLGALARCGRDTMAELAGPPTGGEVPRHPAAARVAERLADRPWARV